MNDNQKNFVVKQIEKHNENSMNIASLAIGIVEAAGGAVAFILGLANSEPLITGVGGVALGSGVGAIANGIFGKIGNKKIVQGYENLQQMEDTQSFEIEGGKTR